MPDATTRNPHLLNKCFRRYLIATILATATSNIAMVVDGIIVGQMLGAASLTAISLTMPLMQLIYTLILLLNMGGTILCSLALGRGEQERANAAFSFSLMLNVAVSLLFVLVGLFWSRELASLLCDDEQLLDYVVGYAQPVLLTAPLYFLLPSLCYFVRIDGAPKLTTYALLLAAVGNLGMDIVLIRFVGMDITGSSIATSIGNTLGISLLVLYFLRKKNKISLCSPFRLVSYGKQLLLGLPIAASSACMTIKLLVVNYFVLSYLGAAGMGALAVFWNILILVSVFAGGIVQTIIPLGGVLLGQEDYHGLHLTVRRAIMTVIVSMLSFTLLMELQPELLPRLFGLSGVHAEGALRVASLCFLFFGVTYFLMALYQLLQQTSISLFTSLVQPLSIIPVIYIFAQNAPEQLWWSFLLAEMFAFALVWTFSHIKGRKGRSSLFLLPAWQSKHARDYSLHPHREEERVAVFAPLKVLLDEHQQDPVVGEEAERSCRLLMQHMPPDEIDLHVIIHDDKVHICLKNDAPPNNPLSQLAEGSLPSSHEARYQNSLNQNCVFLKIPLQNLTS